MNRLLITLATAVLFSTVSVNTALADSHEDGGVEPASPIELWACSYKEGQGPADLDEVVADWNSWADNQGLSNYSAWTLVPYYFGPQQEFDVLWLGGSSKAADLGRAEDMWLAAASDERGAFDEVWTCDGHSNFAALQFKEPPTREDPSNVVISFSDCNMAEGMVFGSLFDSLVEWADYLEESGSNSGMWVLFPVYGGGGEEFDFKLVKSWQNLEQQGTDYDHYNESGWQKAGMLFGNKLDCDSARVYSATNRRMADSDDN